MEFNVFEQIPYKYLQLALTQIESISCSNEW